MEICQTLRLIPLTLLVLILQNVSANNSTATTASTNSSTINTVKTTAPSQTHTSTQAPTATHVKATSTKGVTDRPKTTNKATAASTSKAATTSKTVPRSTGAPIPTHSTKKSTKATTKPPSSPSSTSKTDAAPPTTKPKTTAPNTSPKTENTPRKSTSPVETVTKSPSVPSTMQPTTKPKTVPPTIKPTTKPKVDDCDDWACTTDYDPVCANNGKTYSNKCNLKRAMCKDRKLKLHHKGSCGSMTLSDAGRAGLIASAVVGAVLLFSLYCYCRRQRRYRNSFPAFYNDIALNDPLRQELEYASESQDRHFHNANETSDDDDDAPLIGDHTVFG